jgi:integrase
MMNEKIGAVTLTEVAGSPYFYARFRRYGRQVTRSLKTADIIAARAKAQEIDSDLPIRRRSEADYSYRWFAEQTIEDDRKKVQLGIRGAGIVREGEQYLRTYAGPAFGETDIRKIDYLHLKDFVDELIDRGLKVSSIKKIMVYVGKTLKTAVQRGVLPSMPLMPSVEGKPGVRGWFTREEYKRLLSECRKHEKLKTKVRSHTIDQELRFFVTFMVNTFMRPSDVKYLRHKNVEVVRKGDTRYLRITTDWSKTTTAPIVSMPAAVDVYARLSKLQKSRGYGTAEDYVFLPQHDSRDFAIKELGRMLKKVLATAGLDVSRSGEKRSMYSLRHTAITFRLLMGDVDTVTLARAARTSAEMIDRFYAKHLTAEMNIEKLQRMR